MSRFSVATTLHAAAVGLALACAEPARAGAAPGCVGDCGSDGAVTINELIIGVGIALGSQPLNACSAMDRSGDGIVTIDELVSAVAHALTGCPPAATATAPPTNSPAATFTPPPTAADTATVPPTSEPTSTEVLATPTATPVPTAPAHFCDLPGSVQYTGPGVAAVPGQVAGTTDFSFLHLPVGFCVHYFANIGNVRQLRFAPGGELFVASPTKFTTSNGQGGQAAIMVLPDDNFDGVADPPITFKSNLPATLGMLFANDYLYYQDDTRIMRVPYAAGDRTASAPSEQVATINPYTSLLHWPKTMDMADDGTIYVANGGDEGERCNAGTRPFHGGVLKLDGTPFAAPVAKGFRNPVAVRCARGHNMCFAIELARDFSNTLGGREKLVPIRQDDDWGFPCCASKDLPYSDLNPAPDCSGVSAEIDAFTIGHTPFDLDFEMGKWPEPWKTRVYVPLHGTYGQWFGASLVAVDFDAMTGQVLPGSDLPGMPNGALAEFATGWGDGSNAHGRPTVVAFAPDGRLFLGNDTNGDIVWIAPLDLAMPAEP